MKINYTESPKLTIITAVKDQRMHFERTMQNVFSQPYKNIDYIVIDGGSKDGTCEMIKENENRIKFWISEKDKGLYDALNKGWHAADIDSFIMFLGAGDQLINIPLNDLKIGTSLNEVIYGRVRIGKSIIFKPKINWLSKIANTLHHQAMLVPKTLHQTEPFDTRFRVYADFDFNQRLIKSGVRFRYSRDFLSYALPGGLSTKYSFEAVKISNKNYGYLKCLIAFLFFIYQRGIKKINLVSPLLQKKAAEIYNKF